jgi:porin
MLTRHGPPGSNQGFTPFGAFLWAPKDRNHFPFFLATGFLYRGTAPSRSQDAIAFGVAYGAYSENLRNVQKQAKAQGLLGPYGNRPQTAETLLELNYWAQVTKWLAIVPDIQYIINPKGYGTIKNALVLGMQVGIYL